MPRCLFKITSFAKAIEFVNYTIFTKVVYWVFDSNLRTGLEPNIALGQGSANCCPQRINLWSASTFLFLIEYGSRNKSLRPATMLMWPAERNYSLIRSFFGKTM